ncbi:MOS1T transposase, partial [Acromyrmex heyeri]
MSEIMEQRSAIKFCVRNGISAAETLRMCQKAYGDGALSQARVFAWHRMFKEGRESVQDEPRAGRSTSQYYLGVMRRLRDAVRRKRPELWADNSWLLHHDNAPSHTSLVVRDHFAKNLTHIIPQPPYSPDLAPCDFWLFSKLKRPLRGHRFETIEEIKEKTTSELRAIPTDDYAACFENWKKRWHSCIATGGDYFEGDDTNLDE